MVSAVPDDVAAAFDCESRMAPGGSKKPARVYGKYFGSTFYVDGHQDQPVALLWGKENGYWKIVSWMAGIDADRAPVITDEVKITHVKAEPGLVTAAHDFLQAWLIRKDYDAAFRFLSPSAYGCYDVLRSPTDPAAASPEDAARRIRAGLERAGQMVGPAKNLDGILRPADPIHPAVRLMDHGYQRTFTLTSLPNAIGDAAECDARARNATTPIPLPLDYGQAYGLNMRFGPGEAAVLRALWRNEGGAWRIRSYDVELVIRDRAKATRTDRVARSRADPERPEYAGSTGIALSTSAGNMIAGGPCEAATPARAATTAAPETIRQSTRQGKGERRSFVRRHPSIRTAPAIASHSTGTISRRVVTRSDTNPGSRNSVSR